MPETGRSRRAKARAVLEVIAGADVRDTLARITAPTLVMHREDAVMIPPDYGRYLADHIAGSRYVELPGADTLHWTGDAAAILDEIEEFVTGARAGPTPNVCSPQSFSPISSARLNAPPNSATSAGTTCSTTTTASSATSLSGSRGREVNTAGDGFVATFTSPSVALDCAEAIVEAVRPLGIEVRVGHSRRGSRGTRCRHRGNGGPHRRACRRTRGTERGAGLLDGARDRHRVTPNRSPSAANTT